MTKLGGSRIHGFTLIEVMISLAVLSFILLILSSSFFGIGKVENIVIAGADSRERDGLSRFLLANIIEKQFRGGAAGNMREGDGQKKLAVTTHMVWYGFLEGREGIGGRYRLELFSRRPEGDGVQVLLRFQPFEKYIEETISGSTITSYEERVVLDKVVDFNVAIEYLFDAVVKLDGYYEVKRPEDLRKININIKGIDGDWVPIAVVPRTFLSKVSDSFTVGGGENSFK